MRLGSQSNEFQFAGEQTDPTGLQFLRARYYDPASGTFISRDPLSSLPGWSGSPYAYVGGNPVNAVDPSGLHGNPIHSATDPALLSGKTPDGYWTTNVQRWEWLDQESGIWAICQRQILNGEKVYNCDQQAGYGWGGLGTTLKNATRASLLLELQQDPLYIAWKVISGGLVQNCAADIICSNTVGLILVGTGSALGGDLTPPGEALVAAGLLWFAYSYQQQQDVPTANAGE